MDLRSLRSNARSSRHQAFRTIAVEIPLKRSNNHRDNRLFPKASSTALDTSTRGGTRSPPAKKARTSKSTTLAPIGNSRQLRSRRVDTLVPSGVVANPPITPDAHCNDVPTQKEPDTPTDSPGYASAKERADTPSEGPFETPSESPLENIADTPTQPNDASIEISQPAFHVNNVEQLVEPVEKDATNIKISSKKRFHRESISLVSHANIEQISTAAIATKPEAKKRTSRNRGTNIPGKRGASWYPNITPSFSEAQIFSPLGSSLNSRTAIREHQVERTKDTQGAQRTSLSLTPGPLVMPPKSEALEKQAPFEDMFGEAERLLQRLNAHKGHAGKKVRVNEFYCKLYFLATEGLNTFETLNLLSVCFAYKYKAAVLEFLNVIKDIKDDDGELKVPWAKKAIRVVKERGRDSFDGDIAEYLTLLSEKFPVTKENSEVGIVESAAGEHSTISQRTRASSASADGAEEQEDATGFDMEVETNDQQATSNLPTTPAADEASLEHARPQRPKRAAKTAHKYINPKSKATASGAKSNATAPAAAAPRSKTTPIFIIPTLPLGYPSLSIYNYAKFVTLATLTTDAILAHPAFPQLYLSQDLARSNKPILPTHISADKELAKRYHNLFSHLAQDKDILRGWEGQEVLLRNGAKKGYQMEDVEQYVGVFREGRDPSNKKAVAETVKNVGFNGVLERVREIEARQVSDGEDGALEADSMDDVDEDVIMEDEAEAETEEEVS